MAEILTNAAEFTVSEIAQAVRRTVEENFGYVRVRGEISGFRGQHASGHCYFTLKDENASMDAVVWKGTYPRLAFKPQEGLEVIATGRLTTFPRSSKYQIVIDSIEPAGAGALMALLEERRKKLAAEGLFARERKRKLPYLPRVIGVVTSPTGAVIRDILHRLEDRFPTHVVVWPVRVQGETCAPEVSAAIAGFNALEQGGAIPRPDLLIVARGGGSIEDLWGFNEEAVVRAVAASTIPVISAVGHETDTTLIDHVADLRAPTPTAAAEAAVPVRTELVGYVEDLGQRQRHGARRIAVSYRDRLRAANAGLPRPTDLVAPQRQRLDHAASNLFSCLRHSVQDRRVRFSRSGPRLSPQMLAQRLERSRLTFAPVAANLVPAKRRLIERKATQLRDVAVGLSPAALRAELRHLSTRLGPLLTRLRPAASRLLHERAQRLAGLDKLLNSLSYRSVLARGYAVVKDASGQLVRSHEGLQPGQALDIQFDDGEIGVNVSGAPARPRRRSRPPAGDDGQESLF